MTATTSPITADVLRQAIDGIDAIVRAELYPSYQGRGMTKPCVGVVIPDARDLLALGASIAQVVANNTSSAEDPFAAAAAIDDAIDPIRRARIDSLGTDLIVYWPGVTADQPAEDAAR